MSGRRMPCALRQIVDFNLRFGGFERPRGMMDVSLQQMSLAVMGEQAIALGQKIFNGVARGTLRTLRAQSAIRGAKANGSSGEQPGAFIVNPAAIALLGPHSCPVIGQMKPRPRRQHGQRIRGVEREEVHARRSGALIPHIGA